MGGLRGLFRMQNEIRAGLFTSVVSSINPLGLSRLFINLGAVFNVVTVSMSTIFNRALDSLKSFYNRPVDYCGTLSSEKVTLELALRPFSGFRVRALTSTLGFCFVSLGFWAKRRF
jgi:hypothetical protein